MKKATEKIIDVLRKNGCRITDARVKVVAVLLKAKQPLSIQGLASKVDIDEVSVYRTVNLLKEIGLLESIKIRNDLIKYAIAEHHHHHVICTNCEKVEHVSCDSKIHVPKVDGFKTIDSHEVNFYGLCKNCS